MARQESFNSDLWTEPVFEPLSDAAKLVYLWSFTNPSCDMAGLTRVTAVRMQRELNMAPKRCDKAVEELHESGLMIFEGSWCWSRFKVKHLRTRGEMMAKGVVNSIKRLDPDHPMRQRFVEEYGDTPWLREKGGEAWSALVNETRGVKPKEQTLGEGRGGSKTLHSQGQGSSPSSTATSGKPARDVVEDAPPSDMPEQLVPVVAPVKTHLDRIFAAKGGSVAPTLAAIGRALTAVPQRRYVEEADAFAHWHVHGVGKNRECRDPVAGYRNWLKKADPYIGPTIVPGAATAAAKRVHVDGYGMVDEATAQRIRRRAAE